MADAPLDLDARIPDELQAIADDLCEVYSAPPPPDVASAHLEQLFAAFDRAHPADELELRRRRRVVAVAAAVGVSAAVVLTGGLAAASGSLPGPLQDLAAAVVAPFGVDLPHDGDRTGSSGDEDEGEPTTEATTPAIGQDGAAVPGSGPGPAAADAGTPSEADSTPNAVEGPAVPGSDAPPGQSGQPGNAPEVPPGQSGEQGNRPDVPPGQTTQPGNRPDTPPGQTGEQGNKPEVPPGQAK